MRIGFLDTQSPEDQRLSGVSKYLGGLRARLSEQGVETSVFWTQGEGAGTPDRPYTEPRRPWARYRSIHAPNRALIASLTAWISREEPDVIHCHWPVDQVWALLRDAPPSFPPILVSFHTYEPVCPLKTHVTAAEELCADVSGRICMKQGCRSLRKWLMHDVPLRRLRNNVVTRAAAYLVHNREVRAFLDRTDIRPLRYVPLASDVDGIVPAPHPRRPIVLYAGRLRPEKGIEVLAGAVEPILRAVPEAEVRVAGDGPEIDTLSPLAERFGARVRLLGRLSKQDLYREYAAARLLVMPSTWKEYFGLVGIEAMAHGTPVVAPGIGGIIEWLRHEENGLEVFRNDSKALAAAAVRLLRDPALAARLGRGAAHTARFLGMRAHARALAVLYREQSAPRSRN